MKIYYTGDQEGIVRIQIEARKPNAKMITKENFDTPIRVYDVLKLDTAVIKHTNIEIKIWDKSPVIEDYYLYISPEDWEKKKNIVFRYSTR